MSEIRVTNVIGENGSSPVNFTQGINMSGIVTATSFVPTAQGSLSHRNIIINGAMNVAQRATSSTTNGYGDVDRWQHEYGGTDENPTFAQVDVTSGDAPYLVGLTRAAKITNGNQTSGLQATSQINFMQPIEAQNIRNSGWNYKSSSSYITLSYWVRASVAQEYHGFVKTADGSNYVYPFSLGSLSANTWTKITKTIPGNSNLQIDNNNGAGFQVWPVAFYGTNYTDNAVTNNAWAGWSSGGRSKDQTATWWTTNDSTFEITGVQLEVGSVATPFEHRSFGEEEDRCMRYYEEGSFSFRASGNIVRYCQAFNKRKRANPSMKVYYDNNKTTDGTINSGNSNNSGWSRNATGKNAFNIEKNTGSNGNGVDFAGYYTASAEL